jgi:hypothetical protein
LIRPQSGAITPLQSIPAAELLVLAVHRDLALDEAMRLLGQRPVGTVGRIQRLPAALPEIGAVLQLDPKGQLFNPPAARRGQRQRDRAGGRP